MCTQSASLVSGSKEESTVDLGGAASRTFETHGLGRDGRMGIGAVGLLARWAGSWATSRDGMGDSAEVWLMTALAGKKRICKWKLEIREGES